MVHMRISRLMLWGVRGLLLLAACTPLFVKWNVFFPFAFGKALFFRTVVELALFLWASRALLLLYKEEKGADDWFLGWRSALAHPIVIALGAFFISLVVSTIFAVNNYRAFWGDVERAEGFFGMLHYGVFFLLLLRFFGAREWGGFMKVLFIGGLVLTFYGVLEYFGVKNFPFAIQPVLNADTVRVSSLVGNSAFLATHMLLLVVFAGIFIYFKKDKLQTESRLWSYLALGAAALAVPTIFFTQTRGAILGLIFGVGVWVLLMAMGFSRSSRRVRNAAIAALVGLACLSGVFWVTRSASVWQSIPGLDRLARTESLTTKDASTQTRLITWKVSWEAFKEKPAIGWGPENFLVAYEKHYNPDYALYGETWLDRAHNKVFDVLVTQGSFGLLAYLAIFIAAAYAIVRRRRPEGALILAGLAAYGVQNLVVFDQVVSYPVIFSIFAFVAWRFRPDEAAEQLPPVSWSGNIAREIRIIPPVLTIAMCAYALYALNYIPYRQSVAMRLSPGLGDIDKVVAKVKEGMYPYNFSQINNRGQAVDTSYLDQYFYNDGYRNNPRFRVLGDTLIEGIDEIVRREPYDVRLILREAEMLDPFAYSEPALYKRIEDLLRIALALAPQRQEVLYHLAVNLAKQGRIDEALPIVKEALDMSPEVPRARFHYALILAAARRDKEAQEELAYMERLDPRFQTLLGADHNSVMMLYNAWGRKDKIAELVMKNIDGFVTLRFRDEYYLLAIQYYAANQDASNFIKVATFIENALPTYKDEMEVLVDLAKRGRWDIISGF